jgi:hypothetical protein
MAGLRHTTRFPGCHCKRCGPNCTDPTCHLCRPREHFASVGDRELLNWLRFWQGSFQCVLEGKLPRDCGALEKLRMVEDELALRSSLGTQFRIRGLDDA